MTPPRSETFESAADTLFDSIALMATTEPGSYQWRHARSSGLSALRDAIDARHYQRGPNDRPTINWENLL